MQAAIDKPGGEASGENSQGLGIMGVNESRDTQIKTVGDVLQVRAIEQDWDRKALRRHNVFVARGQSQADFAGNGFR